MYSQLMLKKTLKTIIAQLSFTCLLLCKMNSSKQDTEMKALTMNQKSAKDEVLSLGRPTYAATDVLYRCEYIRRMQEQMNKIWEGTSVNFCEM